jgi:DNA repair photolyase
MRDELKRVWNPPNPWASERIDWVGEPPEKRLVVHHDASRTILSRNNSPDVPFTWSINPYRGCYHACAYCYARPSHETLGFGAGTDFERQLVVKEQAPELLRQHFDKKSWRGELILFSGNTDCYQPLEASYGLTRACLEVCLAYRNPVVIITKSALIERDAELLAELHKEAHCAVLISIPFFNAEHARAIEPTVPTPQRRVKAIRVLAEAGVPVGVNVAPIIPGLSDEDIPQILQASREAGAQFAGMTMVRLPGHVETVFETRLRLTLPRRAEKVLHAIEACRGGRRTDARFGHRMEGTGVRWQAISQLYEKTKSRLGFDVMPPVPQPSPFRRPDRLSPQLELEF